MIATRRNFLGATLALAVDAWRPAAAASARVMLDPLQPGVYVARAVNAEATRANAGAVVPSLVHVTRAGVLVADPGPQAVWGRALLGAIRALTAQPVRWVVNTHAHPEHVLANAAFAGLRPRPLFLASAATAALMRQRCEDCLARLTAQLGRAALRGTEIVLPEPALQDGAWLHTGDTAWQVQVHAPAHSASDTVLYAPQLRLLCAGGLAYRDRVPEMQEASLQGWRQALRQLIALPADTVVATATGTPAQTLVPTLAYLDALTDGIGAALAAGRDASQAADAVAAKPFRHWRHFPTRHPLNLQRAWRQLEDAWMQGEPRA
ncbi:MBL fold metallo-hydrolase [Cupriavidus sp. WGlv3]|uniref:MBL fold metallo-hydrolase n=1 Tax=Cupriavidus sp. WGlv3 TaxID=2919924 RepID=UPI0020902D16|nr:MBL fold metallo-hydrolase [Cupriavidus sp. WGlv3]MCO4864961.1 MBL fold metallo-hydrolase [Cupriavidus sp. WGlv3]